MPTPVDILKQYWGHAQFRPLQEEIVQSVLAGHDTLALLPTGGGKSICFQVPALVKGGLCLVISPLIALMKDQVLNLTKRGIQATAIFTGMGNGEIDAVLEACAAGKYRFLYVSPERLQTRVMQARLGRLGVTLLAIDEAHCISQWGHDFRPEYLKIADIRPFLPGVPVVALTATATARVVDEIMEKLAMKKGHIFRKSFQRSNLAYQVAYEEDKFGAMLAALRQHPGTAVVYAGTRRKTELAAEWLRRQGISAVHYHAGLEAKERDARQRDWIAGKVRVVVCTNAFGMGIDKPDVRLVVHLAPSDCIEAYFQEAGRAGRDEEPALCLLLYHPSDRQEAEHFLALGFPPIETIRQVYAALGQHFQLALGSGKGQRFDFELSSFSSAYNLKPIEVHHSLTFLHRSGYLFVGEEVLLPSKVRFTADATTVYDFRLRHKEFDPFIDLLLRTYSGIMEQYVKIDEFKLAGKLRIMSTDIPPLLKRLQQLELLDYIPKTDKPQIYWLEERIPEDRVVIPDQHYTALLKLKTEKLQAMLHYCESLDNCRSRMLLKYFDEPDAPSCGKCDYCLSLHRHEITEELLRTLAPRFADAAKEETSVESILAQLADLNKTLALHALNWFVEHGQLETTGKDNLRWKK